jgi:hypothetical protein
VAASVRPSGRTATQRVPCMCRHTARAGRPGTQLCTHVQAGAWSHPARAHLGALQPRHDCAHRAIAGRPADARCSGALRLRVAQGQQHDAVHVLAHCSLSTFWLPRGSYASSDTGCDLLRAPKSCTIIYGFIGLKNCSSRGIGRRCPRFGGLRCNLSVPNLIGSEEQSYGHLRLSSRIYLHVSRPVAGCRQRAREKCCRPSSSAPCRASWCVPRCWTRCVRAPQRAAPRSLV